MDAGSDRTPQVGSGFFVSDLWSSGAYKELARRPSEMTSSDEVHVQVKHTLACAGANVEHGAVPILDAEFFRNLGRDYMTVANQL